MRPSRSEERIEGLFRFVVAHARLMLALGALGVAAAVVWLPRLEQDVSVDAYLPAGHPARAYRDEIREVFGLWDPVVIAVVRERPAGVFTPDTLRLVSWLTEALARLDGIDPDRVRSLATEKQITGAGDTMYVGPFFESAPRTQAGADAVREAVLRQEPYLGALVARDGTATVVIGVLLEPERGLDVYARTLALLEEAPAHDAEIHVAGRGAADSYLGDYIDADNRRLNPLAFAVILTLLVVAYRTPRGVILPAAMVIPAVLLPLGLMAALGVPFYNVTSALTVILIAVSVADGIHILGEYYEQVARRPDAAPPDLVVASMVAMWRPVTITSVTSMVGFVGLGLGAFMPPMRAFGLFGAVGIGVAWLYSLLVLPAGLALLPVRSSPAFRAGGASAAADAFGRLMETLVAGVVRRPRGTVAAAAGLAALAALGIARVEQNEQFIANFRETEPIYLADQAINRTLDGTNQLDVVFDASQTEGLFDPERLRRIEAMQAFFESHPLVRGTTSIVDYVKQMNRAMHADRPDAYVLPDDARLVAQYFLLFSAGGSGSDLEHVIDSEYRMANLRVALVNTRFTTLRRVIEDAQAYIDARDWGPGLEVHLGGTLNMNYHWLREILPSHVRSVALAVGLVGLLLAVSYGSLGAGLVAVVPVCVAVLTIYAVMGWLGIWLGLVTSVFAAIAIGVGVDFAVHAFDRSLEQIRERRPVDDALRAMARSTGRAILFSFAAVFLGFGVLIASRAPPLENLGLLISTAVLMSFAASVSLLPALIRLLQGRAFLRPRAARTVPGRPAARRAPSG